jgi:uncharacterized protein (TIGR04255 family)
MRVDYDVLTALQSQERSELTSRIKDHFPLVSGQQVANILVNFAPSGSAVQQQAVGMQWEHRKEAGGTKVLFFTPDHLSLEYGRGDYDHFPPFRAEFEVAYNALIQLYPDCRITRIGLRYINQIQFDQGNPLDWEEYLAPGLVTSVKAGMLGDASLVRSLHQLHTRRGDLNLQMRYGISNPEYPAALSRREFIIDIDCHKTGIVPAGEVVATITALNEMCESEFEACILPAFREHMEPLQ